MKEEKNASFESQSPRPATRPGGLAPGVAQDGSGGGGQPRVREGCGPLEQGRQHPAVQELQRQRVGGPREVREESWAAWAGKTHLKNTTQKKKSTRKTRQEKHEKKTRKRKFCQKNTKNKSALVFPPLITTGHSITTILLQYYYSITVVLPQYYFSITIVLRQYYYSITTISLQYYYSVTTVLPVYYYTPNPWTLDTRRERNTDHATQKKGGKG